MKAKELARKIGTLPPVRAWNSKVPAPAVNKAMEGSSPVSSGTRTSAPKATNSIWTPRISDRPDMAVMQSSSCSGYSSAMVPGVGVEPT